MCFFRIQIYDGPMAVKRLETHIKGSQGQELYLQTWTPDEDQIKGSLLLTHGQAEHSDCYQKLADELSREGWRIFAWDLTGHGRSEGRRGYIDHFSTYVNDLEKVVRYLRQENTLDNQPFILFSHSMGGLIALEALLDKDLGPITAAVFSSPALGFAFEPPGLKKTLAQIANKVFPQLTLYNEVSYSVLSRDEEMLKTYPKDTLRHSRISPAVFFGFLEGFERIPKEAHNLDLPIFFQLPGEDQLISTPASKAVFEKLPNAKNRMEIYHDSFHEIYNDLDRDRVISDLKNFINSFVTA